MRPRTRVGRRMGVRGISIPALSRATNIHVTKLFYIKGGFVPHRDEAERIAAALGTTVAWLGQACGHQTTRPRTLQRRRRDVPDGRPGDALVQIVELIADAIVDRVAARLDGHQQLTVEPPAPWLTTQQAAKRLGKSESFIRRAV